MMNFELVSVSPERYQTFLQAKQAGKSTPEAMEPSASPATTGSR